MFCLKIWTFCVLSCLAWTGIEASTADNKVQNADEECNLPQNVIQDIAAYANVTNIIIDYFTKGPYKGKTWQSLADFVDIYGNRLSGTKNLEDSIDFMVNLLKENNLENVHTEDVQVPYWLRGFEKATLLQPRIKNLPILGLGYSVATPPEGITAEVVAVKSFEELRSLPNEITTGKIIVFAEPFKSYGESVTYRSKGASEASKKGAVAALVRSITPFSLLTPHTGMQRYEQNVTQIPVAALAPEDADQLLRMYNKKQKIVVKLIMSATLETKTSRNTIAELTGAQLPKKVVVVSGHLDSWDVGDGAMDDGGGVFISWVAPVVLKQLNLRPRRTLRAILWTAEEVGLVGAEAYEKAHREDNDDLNFVMESDGGTFSPLGLVYSGSKTGECMMKEVAKLFEPINSHRIQVGDPGPDLTFWISRGVPAGGLMNENDKYFWFHHSEGDTINVIEPDALDRCAAFWTAFSYIVADLSHDIPRK